MAFLLLLAQLVALPVTSAYAQQIHKDVVISVTYGSSTPVQVCSFGYELADEQMLNAIGSTCVEGPISPVGNFLVWPGERLDMINLEVVVKYRNGKTDRIFLTTRIDT